MTVESVAPRSELRVLLEQLGDPCWVLDAAGRIRIQNAAARRELAPPEGVFAAILRGEGSTMAEAYRVRRLAIEAEIWTLILALPPPTDLDTARLFGLEAGDAEIVDHLVAGFSDRELVLLTGRPIGPIHTAIVRIYRSLGISTRSELISALKRARTANAVAARSPTLRSEAVPRGPSVITARVGSGRQDR